MKRPIAVGLILFFILGLSACLTGCSGQVNDSGNGPSSAPFPREEWAHARQQLPLHLWAPPVVQTAATQYPEVAEVAEYLSGALAAYPFYPVTIDSENPPSEEFLLHTALLSVNGSEFGSPDCQGELFSKAWELLGRPGAFLTQEHAEKGLALYFPETALTHQSLYFPMGNYDYRGDLGVYLFPAEGDWYAPVILAYSEDADGLCWAKIAFVRWAPDLGEAYYDPEGNAIAFWEVEAYIAANPALFPCYEVEVQREEGGLRLQQIIPLPTEPPSE